MLAYNHSLCGEDNDNPAMALVWGAQRVLCGWRPVGAGHWGWHWNRAGITERALCWVAFKLASMVLQRVEEGTVGLNEAENGARGGWGGRDPVRKVENRLIWLWGFYLLPYTQNDPSEKVLLNSQHKKLILTTGWGYLYCEQSIVIPKGMHEMYLNDWVHLFYSSWLP